MEYSGGMKILCFDDLMSAKTDPLTASNGLMLLTLKIFLGRQKSYSVVVMVMTGCNIRNAEIPPTAPQGRTLNKHSLLTRSVIAYSLITSSKFVMIGQLLLAVRTLKMICEDLENDLEKKTYMWFNWSCGSSCGSFGIRWSAQTINFCTEM